MQRERGKRRNHFLHIVSPVNLSSFSWLDSGHVASEMIGRFKKNDTTAVSMITFSACFLTYYVSAIHIHGAIGPPAAKYWQPLYAA